MNLVLNVKFNRKLENSDILMYIDGCWTNLSKKDFLFVITKENKQLKADIESMRADMDRLKADIKLLKGED